MRAKCSLTDNAIMYASVGFQQHCLLQVLNLRPGTHSSTEMVVYDGTVYAGALFRPPAIARPPPPLPGPERLLEDHLVVKREKSISVSQLDVIRAKLMFGGMNQPLQISELEVVERGHTSILGPEILSLESYMKRRKFITCLDVDRDMEEEEPNIPNKKVKTNSSVEPLPESSFEREGRPKANNQVPLFERTHSEISSIRHPLMEEKRLAQENPCSFREENRSTDEVNSSRSNQSLPLLKKCRIIPNELREEVEEEELAQSSLGKKEEMDNSLEDRREKPSIPPETVQLLMEDEVKVIEVPNPQKKNFIDLVSDSPRATQKSPKINKVEKSSQPDMMIEDLYERMHRFRILCRINDLRTITSQKGNPYTRLMLVDQKGDQIACLPYEKPTGTSSQDAERSQADRIPLLKGRAYFFQSGEVSQEVNGGALSISVPWNGVQETKLVLQSFHPSKMLRVGQISNIESSQLLEKAISGGMKSTGSGPKSINNRRNNSKEFHVCGIFKGLKEEPKLSNNQFKVVGILCDPDQGVAINFTLFLDELSSFPREGAILSLHNMNILETQRIYKLIQSRRSYFHVENNNTHKYFADLQEASSKEIWKRKDYRNLSQAQFVPRTIAELKALLPQLQQEQCFSEIDCNIAHLREKKEFPACSVCRHEVKSESNSRTYCYHCKKVERTTAGLILSVEVADSTGSIDVTVFNPEIPDFINISVEEYVRMPLEERGDILELSTFKNILLKVRSEQQVGGASHKVDRAEQISHKRGLDQIKEQSITTKTSYLPWQ